MVLLVQSIIIVIKLICLLIAIAYYTIGERKIMAAVQRRRGPNVIGYWGMLQPLADGFKLICKEVILPARSNTLIFIAAPIVILALSLISWSVIPFNLQDLTTDNLLNISWEHNLKKNLPNVSWQHLSELNDIANIQYSLLFILAISSLNVYSLIIAGWASNSKYAFLGALRSSAQMISYEVSIGLVILPVILLAGSLNFVQIVWAQEKTTWFVFPLLPCAIIFLVSMLAETNRTPFDLTEAEAELVAGYNVEYSSIIFAMFFLGEYCNMLLMSTVIVLLFFGGWTLPDFLKNIITSTTLQTILFIIKILIFSFLFILIRATFPRYRYDQLMDIGWKVFLPITLGYLFLVAAILLVFKATPEVLTIYCTMYSEHFFYTNLI